MAQKEKDVLEEILTDETISDQAALFAALADPTRLKLLQILCRQEPPGCRCVNNLSYLLGISQPGVSQHLRVLKSVGLVTGERRGFRIHYFVNSEGLERFQGILSAALQVTESCEAGSCQNDCPSTQLKP